MTVAPGGRGAGMPAGLVASGVGGLGIGLTEFVIAGLLAQVGGDRGVSEARAGGSSRDMR